jgi:hypothetical protein
MSMLVYTEFILVLLCKKLRAYKHTFESIPETNRDRSMHVKFLAQGNNGLPLTGFKPIHCQTPNSCPLSEIKLDKFKTELNLEFWLPFYIFNLSCFVTRNTAVF